MMYSKYDVRKEIRCMHYLLPKQEELTAMLRERKFAPMQIAEQKYADFVSGNMQDFLHYLRICGVRGVMFSFSYYSREDAENRFRLDPKTISLFAQEPSCARTPRDSNPHSRYDEMQGSDYQNYVRYSRFVCETLDLTHPKELRLYGVYQGRVLACQMADAWMERLGLLGRNSLMQTAMTENLGKGSFPFQFISSVDSAEADS